MSMDSPMDEHDDDVVETARHGSGNGNGSNGKRSPLRSILHHSLLGFIGAVRWFPVIFILAVFFWSYYVFVIEVVYLRKADAHVAVQVAYLLAYHVIVVMFLWSFVATITTSPGQVPDHWQLSSEAVQSLNSARSEDEWKERLSRSAREIGVTVVQRSVQGAVRYCEVCLVVKPDRAHHCSICETCVLKMDHHCPWVKNCVGFGNYKFFLLFVSYGYVYCIWLMATTFPFVSAYWARGWDPGEAKVGSVQVLFLLIVAFLFFLFLSSLFWYHLFLVLFNRSTLEQFRTPFLTCGAQKKAYNLGKMGNIRQVFGTSVPKWFLPIHTSLGNGLIYPLNVRVSESVNMGLKESNSVPAMPKQQVHPTTAYEPEQLQHSPYEYERPPPPPLPPLSTISSLENGNGGLLMGGPAPHHPPYGLHHLQQQQQLPHLQQHHRVSSSNGIATTSFNGNGGVAMDPRISPHQADTAVHYMAAPNPSASAISINFSNRFEGTPV